MNKTLLQDKIQSESYTKEQLLTWVNCLPNIGKIKPNDVKVGDVYMHPIFRHPYIVLKKVKGYYVCTLMTSDGDFEQVLEECDSRFYSGKFITKVLFTVTSPIGSFMSTYCNNKQLKKVYTELKSIL